MPHGPTPDKLLSLYAVPPYLLGDWRGPDMPRERDEAVALAEVKTWLRDNAPPWEQRVFPA